MRRQGHRGHQPGKTIPIKRHPVKSFDNEELQSGIARGPVNVDQVMAANFKPELYIEKFPHGFDPFAGDVTALQKKVVYRPTTAQIKLGSTKKEPRYVNISSGENGRGMVQHEKPFAPKNARYVEYKTSANASGPVQHEVPVLDKNSDPIELQSGAVYDLYEDTDNQYQKTDRPYRLTQVQPELTSNPQVDFDPEFDAEYHQVTEKSRKYRNNPDYGYVAAISGLQTPVGQDQPHRTAKASRNQVQAEIWTGDRYEYVVVTPVDHNTQKSNNPRRQLAETDYDQYSVPAYEDQYLEAVDQTSVHLKDRRQQGDFGRDQFAEYDYKVGYVDGKDETAPKSALKNRRQKDGTQTGHYAGIGDHQEIYTEDPRDRWDAAEYRKGRRVQFAQDQQPVEQSYDVEALNEQHLGTVDTQQTRRYQARVDHADANHDLDLRSMRLDEELAVPEQRRRANARPGHYDEQEQVREGEAGYEIPDFDVIIPAELQTEQRRLKQVTGYAETQVQLDDQYDPGEKSSADPVKAKNKKTTSQHQVRSGFEADINPGTRDKAVRSEKIKHQEGPVHQQRQMADGEVEYEARAEEKPASTRRQYSAKQAHETSIPETDSEVRGAKMSGQRNRRQISARAENERAIPEIDDPEGTRLVERQQKGRGVDEFDIAKHAGIDNPTEENAGIDPVTLEAAQSKRHVAREASLDANVATEIHESGASKDGNNSNRRARVPILAPTIEARGQRNVIYRRKKRTEPISPVDEVAAIEGN